MSASLINYSGREIVQGKLGEKLELYLTRIAPFGFSGAVLIAKGELIVLSKGYGLADRERNITNRPNSVFDIGSLTKQFTAAAILKLEEMGKLRVEDPISSYLVNVPEDKVGITIHQVLSHSAGLADLLLDNDGEYDVDAYDYIMKSQEQFLEEALQTELLWEPGIKYSYSNIGYGLLGAIIEHLSGQSYDRFLQEQFFDPLGMKDTGTYLPEWKPEQLAVGYNDGKRWGTALEREMASDGPSWILRAAGGVLSTVEDLYRWSQSLQTYQALNKSSLDKLFSPHIPENAAGTYHYGYGWTIAKKANGMIDVSHNGSNGIFFADMHQFIIDGKTIIFLTNNYNDYTEIIIQNIASLILSNEDVSYPPKVHHPPVVSDLEQFRGIYSHPKMGLIEVTNDSDLLILEPNGQPAMETFAVIDSEKAELYRKSNLNAENIVKGFNNGDYSYLEKFTEAARFQRLVSFLKNFWNPDWAKREDLRGRQVIGTVEERWKEESRIASIVQTGKGMPALQILWKGEEIVGFSTGSNILPARTRFLPVGKSSFIGFHPGVGKAFSVYFEPSDDGGGKDLWVEEQDEPWKKVLL